MMLGLFTTIIYPSVRWTCHPTPTSDISCTTHNGIRLTQRYSSFDVCEKMIKIWQGACVLSVLILQGAVAIAIRLFPGRVSLREGIGAPADAEMNMNLYAYTANAHIYICIYMYACINLYMYICFNYICSGVSPRRVNAYESI